MSDPKPGSRRPGSRQDPPSRRDDGDGDGARAPRGGSRDSTPPARSATPRSGGADRSSGDRGGGRGGDRGGSRGGDSGGSRGGGAVRRHP